MIRPVLEYASLAWNAYYQKDINTLETTQKRAQKLSRPPAESVRTTRGRPL